MSTVPAAFAQTPAEWAPGRVIVMERAGLSQAELDKALRPHGGNARRLGRSGLHVVNLPAGASETAVAAALRRNPMFKFAELDYKVRPLLQSNDPYAPNQWHLPKIRSNGAWDYVTGAGVTIAILDTGVMSTHQDLASNLAAGWNSYDNNNNWEDVHGHGTWTAGTAAASLNNAIGVAGVAGGARIMPIRVTDATGQGYYSSIASGITYAADNGARVASASFGTLFASSTIASAASYLKSKGGLLVVAAGNNGINESTPATTAMIVASATDSADNLAGWSSYGPMVSVAAPGVGIWTTSRDGGYASVNGTSFSTPATAGVLALIMSANPALSAPQVENVLFNSAVDLGAAGRDIYFGYGRVDADAAVLLARSTSAADSQSPSVAIASPAGGVSVSGVVLVDVTASDNVGVTRVELRANGVVVATDSVAPYSFAWDSSTSTGAVTLTAAAYDAAGNSRVSAGVVVSTASAVADTTAPTVGFNSPGDGASVSGTVQIKIAAADNAGAAGISQTLSIDGVRVASTTGGSLNYSWNTRKTAMGSHVLTVSVRDAAGNSAAKSITVRRVK